MAQPSKLKDKWAKWPYPLGPGETRHYTWYREWTDANQVRHPGPVDLVTHRAIENAKRKRQAVAQAKRLALGLLPVVDVGMEGHHLANALVDVLKQWLKDYPQWNALMQAAVINEALRALHKRCYQAMPRKAGAQEKQDA